MEQNDLLTILTTSARSAVDSSSSDNIQTKVKVKLYAWTCRNWLEQIAIVNQ